MPSIGGRWSRVTLSSIEIVVGQGPIVLAIDADGKYLNIFVYNLLFSVSFSPLPCKISQYPDID